MNVRAQFAMAACVAAVVTQQPKPTLTGRWRLDGGKSDHPGVLPSADSGSRRGGGFGGGRSGGGGFGGGRGGYGGRRGGTADTSNDSTMRAGRSRTLTLVQQLLFHAPAVLRLVQTDSAVVFRADSTDSLVLFIDGRPATQQVTDSATAEVRGHWQGNAFLVERRVAEGKVTEVYLRSAGSPELDVIVDFDGGPGRTISFRRVYDLAADPP